jgi:hypothetical protein
VDVELALDEFGGSLTAAGIPLSADRARPPLATGPRTMQM